MLKVCAAISIALLLPVCLQSKLEDHFKKIENVSGDHSIKSVDFIYLINLDERPEKYEKCMKQLRPFGITPYRFSAVNGWKLSYDTIQSVGVKYRQGMRFAESTRFTNNPSNEKKHEKIPKLGKTYFVHCFSRGTIGIALSHLSILQDAYDRGYETIWVLEDDFKLHSNPKLLSYYIEKLDARLGKNWDILFTDKDYRNAKGEAVPCNCYDKRRPNFRPKSQDRFKIRRSISSEFMQIGARYGAHSVVYRRSGIEKILAFFKKYKIYFPYDIDFFAPKGIKMYCLKKDLIGNRLGAESDNGKPGYLKKGKE